MHSTTRLCALFLLSLFVLRATFAAEPTSAPRIGDLCKTLWNDCRHDLTVQYRQADGSQYQQTFPLTPPPVQNKTLVNVYAGETLRLAAKVEGDRIGELATASANDDPSHVIEISLKQQPAKPDMMLVIKNPFDRPLRYKANIVVPPQNGPAPTSVCPVLAGKMGIEMWPYPVFQALLLDFRFLPSLDSTNSRCE